MNLEQVKLLALIYQEEGEELSKAVKLAVDEIKRNEDKKYGIHRGTLLQGR